MLAPLPAPRLRRVLLMALLERRSRAVLLVDWAGFWSPLAVRVTGVSSYVDAVSETVRVLLGDAPVRYGAVVGHLWATHPQPESGIRVERRPMFVIPTAPLCTGIIDRLADQLPSPARWWTSEQLRKAGVTVFPPELPEVVEGYWDGWLPDGPLTMDPF